MADLIEVKPEQLHDFWPFLMRGVADIKRQFKPNWLPEDIFSAIRVQQVNCVIARRAERLLGFVVYSKQLLPFSFAPEAFVWLAWNLPIREWHPDDRMPSTVKQVWDYIADIARKQYGTDRVTWVTTPSRARAFARKFGWEPSWVTMTAKV
jgi:hypothetical protein